MPVLSFLKEQGVIVFREAYMVIDSKSGQPDHNQVVAKMIKMPVAHMVDPRIERSTRNNKENAVISFKLPDGVRSNNLTDGVCTPALSMHKDSLCSLSNLRTAEVLAKVRFVKFTFIDHASNKLFDGKGIQNILNGDQALTPIDVATRFFNQQRQAMYSEKEEQDQILEALGRKACQLNCEYAPKLPNRPILKTYSR